VRLIRLEAIAFGPLEQRSFAVDADVVLVHGPNEAGKSSFRAAIETLLYGFKPADRNEHPLARWDPENPQRLELRCELRLDTGDLHRVERVLLQTGKLRLAAGGADFSGARRGNTALPWVEWLARDVFRELYSLELGQLAELQSKVRKNIDELLMPRTSALPLYSAAEIRAGLRDEHCRLWRADNRGEPVAKKLRGALLEALARAREVKAADETRRGARSERARVAATLEELESRRRQLDRDHADAPFLSELFELNRRARMLGAPIDLDELGELPLVSPARLALEIEEREAELLDPRMRLEQDSLSLGDAALRILALEPQIECACTELAQWNADCERRAEHEQTSARARERARDELRAALGCEPTGAQIDAAVAVPIEALASVAEEWSESRDRQFESAASVRGRSKVWEAIAGCAGLGVIAFGLYPQLHLLLVVTGASLVVAALLIGAFARPRVGAEPASAPHAFGELLGDLPIPKALSGSPAAVQRLVGLLRGIQQLVADARDGDRIVQELDSQIEQRVSAWRALCQRIGADTDGGGGLLVARLRAALESARAERRSVERDQAERAEAARLCKLATPSLEQKIAHRDRLHAVLRAAEPDCSDLEAAFQRVGERREEAAFLRRRASELRADTRFAVFESDPRVVCDGPPERAPWLPETSAARRAEIADLEERIALGHRRLGELSEILGGDEVGALSRASDAVVDIRREIESVEIERDRLALLESILERAEREYRELHQPDVLRRASRYLQQVTEGRYQRVDLIEGSDAGLCVTLNGRDEPIPVRDPISQGTLDQIFLCLRLGMLDHLDEGRERLPLIIDDALLRMDDLRRRKVYALLGEMAPTRQVWILTCHRALADEIQAALDVSRIEL
jgi:uncharacterized protein YhaN